MSRRLTRRTGNPPENWTCSIASSSGSHWAVISIGFSGRLSRFYLLDLRSDRLIPGQFLAGRASVLSMSAGGDLFAYYCENFNDYPSAYIAVAKPPFCTALAWWGTSHCAWADASFGDQTISVLSYEWYRGGERAPKRDYVEPDCPYQIIAAKELVGGTGRGSDRAQDNHRERTLTVKNGVLRADESVLHVFEKETFEEIGTPNWASHWKVSPSDQAKRAKFLRL